MTTPEEPRIDLIVSLVELIFQAGELLATFAAGILQDNLTALFEHIVDFFQQDSM
jgi:hypothetical protein